YAAQRAAVAADLERERGRGRRRGPSRRGTAGEPYTGQQRQRRTLRRTGAVPRDQIFSPRARSSAITTDRPSLSIRRIPRAEIRSVIQRRSSSSQKRLVRRLISKRRLVWRFEWLTL